MGHREAMTRSVSWSRDAIDQALERLTLLDPDQARIIELRFFYGWTQEQIAQDIGVTQMQVSRLLSRILSDLRSQIGEAQDGEGPSADG